VSVAETSPESEGLDDDTLLALREILDDPSIPIAAAAEVPGGVRIARLREVLDHLVTVRAGAVALAGGGAALVHALAGLDGGLAEVVSQHVDAVGLVSGLPSGRARNAVLGDIGRGDLVALAPNVSSWTWSPVAQEGVDPTLRRASGELALDTYPGFFETILARHPAIGGVVAIPTNRQGVTWAAGSAGWLVNVADATFHDHDVIATEQDLR